MSMILFGDSLGCGENGGVLVAQLGVLLDVLDEVDERVLVELPVAKVRLALQHPLGCKARQRKEDPIKLGDGGTDSGADMIPFDPPSLSGKQHFCMAPSLFNEYDNL